MTDKEFRRLSRRQLVDIIFELQKQLKISQMALDAANEKLEIRDAKLKNAGSIAEAALSLNDVFAHAQAAADMYVDQVSQIYESAQAEAGRILAEARQQADAILAEARLEQKARAAGPDRNI